MRLLDLSSPKKIEKQYKEVILKLKKLYAAYHTDFLNSIKMIILLLLLILTDSIPKNIKTWMELTSLKVHVIGF